MALPNLRRKGRLPHPGGAPGLANPYQHHQQQQPHYQNYPQYEDAYYGEEEWGSEEYDEEAEVLTEFGPDDEPTPSQLHSFARMIGIDPNRDFDLMNLAREGTFFQ